MGGAHPEGSPNVPPPSDAELAARMPVRWDPIDKIAARDKAIGCLLGLAVGDAMGGAVEFAPRDSFPPITDLVGGGLFERKPGEWTDDTTMAICLAEWLLKLAWRDKIEDLALALFDRA